MVQLSHLCMITGEILTLTIWTFVSKVMSLALNMLSKIFIAFLSRCMCLLISWLQSQMEDGNFRLSTRFLEHHPVTSPSINQKKVTHPTAITPNFALKNHSMKTIMEFSLLNMSCLYSLLSTCKIHFTTTRVSVYWLCWEPGEQTQAMFDAILF